MEPLFKTQHLLFGGFLPYDEITIPKGLVTFITGESGSGKSTLFRMMNGTQSPSSGHIFYQGKDVSEWDAVSLRQEVSLAAQDVFLFDGTIRSNFEDFSQYRKMPPPPDAAIRQWLDLVLLDFTPDAPVQTLSGGEKQRLFLSVFLSFYPKVLLLDEPTSALDDQTGAAVLFNIIGWGKANGIELVLISHNRELADRFSENTVHIRKQVIL